jgi:hypothetical protein
MEQQEENAFPTHVGKIWEKLNNEVLWLHEQWRIYRSLFGTEERVGLLNKSTPEFFAVFHHCLLNEVELSLCKLGDPSGQKDKRNLTLSQLQDAIEMAEGGVVECPKNAILIFRESTERIRDRRNKIIAHTDFTVGMSEEDEKLRRPSRREVEKSLQLLRRVMHEIASYYKVRVIHYQVPQNSSVGNRMMSVLLKAQRYDELLSASPSEKVNMRLLTERLGNHSMPEDGDASW